MRMNEWIVPVDENEEALRECKENEKVEITKKKQRKMRKVCPKIMSICQYAAKLVFANHELFSNLPKFILCSIRSQNLSLRINALPSTLQQCHNLMSFFALCFRQIQPKVEEGQGRRKNEQRAKCDWTDPLKMRLKLNYIWESGLLHKVAMWQNWWTQWDRKWVKSKGKTWRNDAALEPILVQ